MPLLIGIERIIYAIVYLLGVSTLISHRGHVEWSQGFTIHPSWVASQYKHINPCWIVWLLAHWV